MNTWRLIPDLFLGMALAYLAGVIWITPPLTKAEGMLSAAFAAGSVARLYGET